MILPTHYFRSHIVRGARCLTRIVWGLDSRHTKISQPQVPIIVEYEVLRLYVSVDYLCFVHSFQSMYETGNEEASDLHGELPLPCYVVSKVSTQQQIHY